MGNRQKVILIPPNLIIKITPNYWVALENGHKYMVSRMTSTGDLRLLRIFLLMGTQ